MKALAARLALVLLGLFGAAPCAASQQASVTELAARIAAEGDAVAPQVFYDLGSIGTLEALAVLKGALDGLREDHQREYLLDACAIFAEQRTRAAGLEFLTEVARRGAQPIDRLAATRALCAYDRDAREVLLEIARGEDVECRHAAADGLAPLLLASSDPAMVDLALDLALARPDPATRRRYVGLTRELREATAKLTHRDVLAACAARLPKGPAEARALERLVAGQVGRAWKRVLVDALGDRPDPAVVATLVRLLRDLDPTLVLAALEKLGGHRARGAWDTFDEDLPPLLSAKDDAVRCAAVFALGAFGASDPRWAKEVMELSRSKDRVVRQGAARALGELRTPPAVARLGELVTDQDWTVRYEALKALERLRLPETVPLLVERLAQETLRMSIEIDHSLRLLTGAAPPRTQWARWLADQPQPLVLPTFEAALAAENERRGANPDGSGGDSVVGFFDIRVVSDRVIFVCDMSSSMEEPAKEVPRTAGSVVRDGRGAMTRFELAKLQLREVLRTIPDDTLFNVIFFSDRLESFARQMTRMKRAVRPKAEKWVTDQFPLGATNVYDALQAAFLEPTVDTLYVLTDGHPTEGELTDEGEIRARVAHWNATRHVRIHTISLGRHSPLLEGLALDTGGTYREFQ
jgi:HEAT repeat protein